MRPTIVHTSPEKSHVSFDSLEPGVFFSKRGGLFLKIDSERVMVFEPLTEGLEQGESPIPAFGTSPWSSYTSVLPVKVRIEVTP